MVTVYGAERVDGRVGLWMEFIRGRRLDELLREQGALSAHEAAVTGLTVCRALSAVHRAGLLHRDIKAQNVMREDGGRLLLMDFGTGTLVSEARRTATPRRAWRGRRCTWPRSSLRAERPRSRATSTASVSSSSTSSRGRSP